MQAIEDGDTGDRELATLAVPGHASRRVTFCEQPSDAPFTADTARMWLPDPELLAGTTLPPNFELDQ